MTYVSKSPFKSEAAVKRLFDDYVNRCAITMSQVFEESGSRVVEMRSWLFESAPSMSAKIDTMHTDPLRIVSEYVGITESDEQFEALTIKYDELFPHVCPQPVII